MVKHLDGCDADVVGLNIPTGIPLLYDLNDDYTPVTPGEALLTTRRPAALHAKSENTQGRREK